jgi:hypothetical protein
MNKPGLHERRRLDRRNVSYYLPIMDKNTLQIIGHLVDISVTGLMMDSKIPIPTNLNYDFHLDFTEVIGGKTFLEFSVISRWCRHDSIQPHFYNAGFEIRSIAPEDIEVLKSMAEKYGAG